VSCTNILQNFKGLWFGLRRRNGTLWVSKVSSCVCWSRRFNEGKPAPSTFSRMKRNPIILYWSYQLLKSLNPKSLPPLHFWNWPFGKWNVITSGFFEVLPPPLSLTHTQHTQIQAPNIVYAYMNCWSLSPTKASLPILHMWSDPFGKWNNIFGFFEIRPHTNVETLHSNILTWPPPPQPPSLAPQTNRSKQENQAAQLHSWALLNDIHNDDEKYSTYYSIGNT